MGDIQQTFKLLAEPQALLSVESFNNPETNNDKNNTYLFWNSSSDTNGIVAIATYTNLKNSSFTDSNGQVHHIAKIVRTFSNLKRSHNQDTGFIKWVLGDSWKQSLKYQDFTNLRISRDPSNGAMYLNASNISVSDRYYDDQGNEIDPTGGFYVFSSLNEDDDGDNESVSSTGLTMKAVAGSTIDVQSDGRLEASSSNKNGDKFDWDGMGNPDLYKGSGLGFINAKNPIINFRVAAKNGKDNINALWFTINTILPSAPVTLKTTSTNFHYDTNLI